MKKTTKQPRRKLTLNTETIRVLQDDKLTKVVGGLLATTYHSDCCSELAPTCG